jgi:anhydro-N-acetylmuramic acid kinase
VRNPTLMARLAADAAGRFRLGLVDELGVPARYREAYAFAMLGWLTWHGLPGALPSVTGAREAALLGSVTPGRAPLALPAPRTRGLSRLRVEVS